MKFLEVARNKEYNKFQSKAQRNKTYCITIDIIVICLLVVSPETSYSLTIRKFCLISSFFVTTRRISRL